MCGARNLNLGEDHIQDKCFTSCTLFLALEHLLKCTTKIIISHLLFHLQHINYFILLIIFKWLHYNLHHSSFFSMSLLPSLNLWLIAPKQPPQLTLLFLISHFLSKAQVTRTLICIKCLLLVNRVNQLKEWQVEKEFYYATSWAIRKWQTI